MQSELRRARTTSSKGMPADQYDRVRYAWIARASRRSGSSETMYDPTRRSPNSTFNSPFELGLEPVPGAFAARLRRGFNDHLVKPVDLAALERALAGLPAVISS